MPYTPRDVLTHDDSIAARVRAVRSMSDVVAWVEAEASPSDFLLLDVRSRETFAKGHVRGALNVPLAELDALREQLPIHREYVAYCGGGTCNAGHEAALSLAKRSYFAQEMNAGWAEWSAAGHPTHAGAVAKGALACACSKGWAQAPVAPSKETVPAEAATQKAPEASAAPPARSVPVPPSETKAAPEAPGKAKAPEASPPTSEGTASAEPTGPPEEASPLERLARLEHGAAAHPAVAR